MVNGEPRMGEMRNAFSDFVRKPDSRDLLGGQGVGT